MDLTNHITHMKRLSTLLLALSATAAAVAQTDVTKYYLSNYGFDTDFNYTKESSVNVAEEVLDIPGWTADNSASYTIAGVYEMGFKGKYNGASVPATGYDGEAGGGLALSTGWDQTFKYYQTVTLPAGTYTLSVPTYNGSDKTAATSLVAWIPSSGTQVASRLASYPIGKWTLDKITFTLTKTTTGKIQIGMKAAANGSANSAKIFIDYVKLEGTDMAVDKTELEQTIRTALEYYGDGSGNEAESLLKAITAAQTTDRDETADIISVLEETRALNDAIAAYRAVNISEENPYDVTHYIQNPSFEDYSAQGTPASGGVENAPKGWNLYLNGAQCTTKSEIQAAGVSGWCAINGGDNIGLELEDGTWVDHQYTDGERLWGIWNDVIPEVELSQTLTAMPAGTYTLTCDVLVQYNWAGYCITTQRIFANDYVAMYSYESNYANNLPKDAQDAVAIDNLVEDIQVPHINYAGHECESPRSDYSHTVSLTFGLAEKGDIHIGFRTNNVDRDGVARNQGIGWFKLDNWRLTYDSDEVPVGADVKAPKAVVTLDDITALIDEYLTEGSTITLDDITNLIDEYLAQ